MLYGKFIESKQVNKKTLNLKTFASDCVIKKNVTPIPLLIYYVKLYMLHPLINALILET